jgi:hypothetical protein
MQCSVSCACRSFIKGQKYNLLSGHENLTLEGKRSLKILLAANKRLNTAYVLKEAVGQLWDDGREGWAGASSTTGEQASNGSAALEPASASPI